MWKPACSRVDVRRANADVAPRVEDLLRPVAVVRVDIDDGDRRADALAESCGCDRAVVEVARTAVTRSARVMSRRPAARVRVRRTLEDDVDRSQCDVDRGAHGSPATGADQ